MNNIKKQKHNMRKCFTRISILDNVDFLVKKLKKLGYKRITTKQFHKNITVYFGVECGCLPQFLKIQEQLHNIHESLHLGGVN